MIDGLLLLERIQVLESRFKHQMEKLDRIADDALENVADRKSYSLALIDAH